PSRSGPAPRRGGWRRARGGDLPRSGRGRCGSSMNRSAGPVPTIRAMPRPSPTGSPALPELRWFSAADVTAAMPSLVERLRLADDPETGSPTPILDGGPITAQRTAAVSGLAIERFGPSKRDGLDVALIGTGVQGHSRLPVLAHLLPGATLHVFNADRDRAEAF